MGSLVFNQIKLTGFKSFVEPTDFIIKSGLTGIVGPNGCGKSNLLEAIRWVMGANSAKAMRGAAMEDVIFSGTKQRPGRNQAYVTLTIDNSSRIAPSIFNDNDTLEITRIITKGKGSAYKVNNRTVRAKDVQLLFADASTGANSPALVRQGQINELISAKPSNRRRILEEAAGISGLYSRRHEAELRLKAAETNLSRLDVILGQIESQLLSLKRQSRQAARYKRLAGEIHEYKALLWLIRWSAALEGHEQSSETVRKCEKLVSDTALKALNIQNIAEKMRVSLEPKREEQIIAAAVLGRLNASKEALENEEYAAKSELRKLETQKEQLETDLSREKGIVEDASIAEARLNSEFEKLNSAEDISLIMQEAADSAELAISKRSNLESEYNEYTRKIADHIARNEAINKEKKQIEDRLKKLKEEDGEINYKLNDIKGEKNSSENLFSTEAKQALIDLELARKKELSHLAVKQSIENKCNIASELFQKSQNKLSTLLAEKSALKKVITRAYDSNWTPVLSLLDVQKGYELAIAASVGEDLDAAIDNGANLRWSGAPTPSQTLPPGAQSITHFVKAPRELQARMSQIGVVNVEKIVTLARELKPGQCLVTVEGHVARWDGFEITAGTETSAAIKIKQQARINEITEEINVLERETNNYRTNLEKLKSDLSSATDEVLLAKKALPELERRERSAQLAKVKYESDITTQIIKKQSLVGRKDQITNEITKLNAQYEPLLQLHSNLSKVEDLSKVQNDVSIRLNNARSIADEKSGLYQGLKNELQTRSLRLRSVVEERSNWKIRSETATSRVIILEGRLSAVELVLSKALNNPDEFSDRRNKLFRELEKAEKKRSDAADTLAKAEKEFQETDRTARSAEAKASEARETRASALAHEIAAKEKIVETQARINEALQCTPEDLPTHLINLKPDSALSEYDIERKIERLSNERERMGDVNLRADEETNEQKDKFEELNKERLDLQAAINRLRDGISELNAEGRQRLLKAFDIVNEHFSKLFKTLFGGGEASLALTESDDPLEAGLEVMVSPPGKKLGSMSLMSGGEQALTATALIFAVFLSNPAPICVLDEVDAPLDDTNVTRYCNLLDAMTKQTKTKFIAITHNAVTMSRMDRLFGVTMAEQGVSQLLSMELGDAKNLVADE